MQEPYVILQHEANTSFDAVVELGLAAEISSALAQESTTIEQALLDRGYYPIADKVPGSSFIFSLMYSGETLVFTYDYRLMYNDSKGKWFTLHEVSRAI